MEKQVIEINGVKLEVDMRYARRIDTLQVGSKVKLLCKSSYGTPSVHPGVVVGFEPFKDLPTIIVAYLIVNYSEAKLEIAYINSGSADKFDIVHSVDDEIPIQKSEVLDLFERERLKHIQAIEELNRREQYFNRQFGVYFKNTEAVESV